MIIVKYTPHLYQCEVSRLTEVNREPETKEESMQSEYVKKKLDYIIMLSAMFPAKEAIKHPM